MRKAKNWNQWSKIRSALRKVWMYSPQRRMALASRKTGDNLYLCELCIPPKLHPKYAVEVDHITPCGTLKGLGDVKQFVDYLFHGELRVICKPCHAERKKKKRDA